MKLTVNYDLINRIKESKKGFCLSKTIKHNLCLTLPFTLTTLLFMENKLEKLILFVASNFMWDFLEFLSSPNEKVMQDSNCNLDLLPDKLYKLDIRTTIPLLQESKIIQTNYEIIKYRDDKLPVLTQKKYITIPLSNGHEETILQEHVFGDDSYELSVQEPTKKLKFEAVHAM